MGDVLEYWDDLLPRGPEPDHAYAALSEAQLRRLARLSRARWLVDTGKDSRDGATAREVSALVQEFAAEDLDAAWLLARRDEVRRCRIEHARRPDVDGKLVTLVGLVLPLDWSRGTAETQRFLFAPELSECSHEPPPNHSRVAHVETSTAIDVSYDDTHMVGGDPCVAITGRVRFSAASNSAYRVDGMMRIDSSYVIEPASVVAASGADIAVRR